VDYIMADCTEDRQVVGEMMVDAYVALRKKYPNHELLGLVSLDEDCRGWRYSEGFWDRCLSPKEIGIKRETLFAQIHYTDALIDAENGALVMGCLNGHSQN
jgi:hypothetical protein